MPELVPASKEVNSFTLRAMLPYWLDNLAENLPAIRSSVFDVTRVPKKKEPVIIVGAGPSLKYFKHLEMIRNSGWKHPVLSCDKVLLDCLKHKIIPYAVATVDGSPQIAGFYSAPIVRKHCKQIFGLFNTLAHPKTVAAWSNYGGVPYWFNTMLDLPDGPEGVNPRSMSYWLWNLTKQKPLISGVGNVGAFLWNFATELEADPIILVGFDFSEQVEKKNDGIYFPQTVNMFMRKYNDVDKASDAAAEVHQQEINPDFIAEETGKGWYENYYEKGKPVRYLVNPVWKEYRNKLAAHINSCEHTTTINSTGNGCLHSQAKDDEGKLILNSPNFKCQPLKEVLDEYGTS
jgi:hypothetical protein